MYDSFLYGYGLSLALFSKIETIAIENKETVKYQFSFNDFLNTFLQAKDHKKILRDFYKYFELNSKRQRAHDDARDFLNSNACLLYTSPSPRDRS